MVDPILYGNYSSRLSHSCNPNCQTHPQIRRGEYSIGMYAQKDIQYGDELSFNYFSTTESEKEFLEAVCLCGSSVCSGHYLTFSSNESKTNQMFAKTMKQYHTFLDRNYILFQASTNPELSPEQEKLLADFGIKELTLSMGERQAPPWLKKWAALTLEFVDFELGQRSEICLQQNKALTVDDRVNPRLSG